MNCTDVDDASSLPDEDGSRGFVFADFHFEPSNHGPGLLIIFTTGPCTEHLFAEVIRIAQLGGQVHWLRFEPFQAVPRVTPPPSSAVLNRIVMSYSLNRMWELVATRCSRLHLHDAYDDDGDGGAIEMDALVCQLDGDDDVCHADSCAATMAMLVDASVYVMKMRERRCDDEAEDDEEQTEMDCFPVICTIRDPLEAEQRSVYRRLANLYTDAVLCIDVHGQMSQC